ncbi:MAG: alpha/beta hydrolase-fold protein [Sphingomicrobium sp.]
MDYLPSLAGDYFPLHSLKLGTYHLYVRLPESYREKPDARYPVVYLLDGDSLFPYLAPHHLFLTYDDQLPEAILVGVAYGSFGPPVNRRERDFRQGAPAFHRFLKDRVIPAVERRVRADPQRRILVGQSASGGFVLYSAYSDPGLFWGRIASNPSFPTHRALLFGPPPPSTGSEVRLVVASGTADRPNIRAGTLEYFDAQSKHPGPWRLHRLDIMNGTHAADMPTAYRRGMAWLFDREKL